MLGVNFTFKHGALEKALRGQIQEFILTDEEANAAPGSMQAFYKDRPYCFSDQLRFLADFETFVGTITNDQLIELRTDWPKLDQCIFHKAFEAANDHGKFYVVGFHSMIVFQRAKNLSLQKKLFEDILRFWVMARMNEGGWTLSLASDTLASDVLTSDIQAHTEVTEIRYIDDQLAKTLGDALAKICQKIFRGLKSLYKSQDADDWLPKFLVTYILLHHWETLMKQQEAIARERKIEVSGVVRLP